MKCSVLLTSRFIIGGFWRAKWVTVTFLGGMAKKQQKRVIDTFFGERSLHFSVRSARRIFRFFMKNRSMLQLRAVYSNVRRYSYES